MNEDRIRNLNRLHREMKIYFPEYKDAFGKIDGAFSLELLKAAPFPDELAALGTGGMKQIWHEAKIRGRGYANASSILEYARKSVGIKDEWMPADRLLSGSSAGLSSLMSSFQI